MVKAWCVHVITYLVVNGLLIALWVLLGDGSADQVPGALANLEEARAVGFWPMTVILVWGAALTIHTGIVVVGWPGRVRRRRRRRALEREGRGRRGVPHVHGFDRHGHDVHVEGLHLHDDDRDADDHHPDLAAAGAPGRSSPTERPAGGVTGRYWITVMFTDIVESTTLNEAMGDEAWFARLAEHRAAVRACTTEHGGVEVSTQGDGFLLRFPAPDAAVACAAALHAAATGSGDDGPPLRLRIGIHAGEVVHDDDDLVGKVVNLAARVTDAAAADEILITEPVADHLGEPHRVVDRGLASLKGFSRPRHLFAVVWQPAPDHLDLDDPEPADR